ncbi:MAG TPA: LPS export ABC transporter permease LptF [Thermoanaerobaculia bacterium]|nr:LPS export ABC transporter permease LptF [Thermoanaerobaculia bacterium]
MLARLDRYLLREILGPFSLGLLIYTTILLVQQFFQIAEWVIKRGIPAATIGRLLLYLLPSIAVLTIPMALLLGVLVGIGRMASDSELVALRACGMGVFRLLRPVLIFSMLVGAFNLVLTLQLLPRANAAYRALAVEAATASLGAQIEPRVFYTEFQGKVLYVFDAPPRQGDWRGVFLADSVPGGGNRPSDIIVARSGRLELEEEGERVLLQLRDAVQHTYDVLRPDRYETRRYQSLNLVLRDSFASEERARALTRRSTRALTIGELAALAADPSESPEQRNLARVDMHKMFAIPAASLVLGLLALPLAFNNRRGGKSSGFALSIGIVVVYHVFLTQGEEAARAGKMAPALAMWLPNLLLGALGVAMVFARNRDRSLIPRFLSEGLLIRRLAPLAARLRRQAPRRAAALRRPHTPGSEVVPPASRPARVVFRLPRFRLLFPNLLDRYVLRRFIFIFVLVLLSAVTLRVIADFTENVDDILRNAPTTPTVIRYYKYQALQMAFDVSPLVVLVTTLVTFSLLARTNEITATKALGISHYRLSVPAVAGAALVALVAVFLQAQVLPASNTKVSEARDRIKGRPSQRMVRSADKQWLIGQGRFMYNYLGFDERRQALQRLQVFEFDDEHRLVARLYAQEARYGESGWVLDQGWTRTFEGRDQVDYRAFSEPLGVDLPESPSYFAAEVRRPAEMTFGELRRYVNDLRESGQPQPKYEVALQNQLAFPVGSIVMALVGLPFAFRLQRRGALYGLGMSVVLGIVFLAVYALFSTLGEVGALPAVVAVWSPSVLFSVYAAYLFLGVRT